MENDRILFKVRIDHVLPARFQPRQEFPDEVIAQLATSMKEVGQTTPILVRPAALPEGVTDSDPWYELVCGECRVRAAKRLGWPTLWAVSQELPNNEAALCGMVDNEQRRSLNPIERATGYLRLMNEYQLTPEAVCQRSGITRSTVYRLLKLLDEPPEIVEMLRKGTLSEFHCRELDRITDRKKRVALAKEVSERGMSGQEIAKRVQQLMGKKTVKHSKKEKPEDLATIYNRFRFWWEGAEVVVRAPNIRPDDSVNQYVEDFRAAIEAFKRNEPRPGAVSAGSPPSLLASAPEANVSGSRPDSTTSLSGTEPPAQGGGTVQNFDPHAEAEAIAKSFKELGDILRDLPKTAGEEPKK